MSAQEFKPGDRVRTHNGVGTVRGPNAPATVEYDDGGWDSLSNPRIIASICRLDDPTEPEFVVGQQVSEGDYERLPVGSVVEHPSGPTRTKVADNQWRPDAAHLLTLRDRTMTSTRTLTHLGDGTHVTEPSVDNSEDITEPEDADDVEPEPLKEGDWVQVWAQVTRRTDDSGEFEHLIRERDDSGLGSYHLWQVHPDAIVRPDAGQVPPWVKPAPVKPEEPDVLGAVVYSDSNGKFWTRASIDPEESHVWAGAYDKCWFNWRQLPDDVVVWDPSDPARGGAS